MDKLIWILFMWTVTPAQYPGLKYSGKHMVFASNVLAARVMNFISFQYYIYFPLSFHSHKNQKEMQVHFIVCLMLRLEREPNV